jgi:hypothetical protein
MTTGKQNEKYQVKIVPAGMGGPEDIEAEQPSE